MNKNLIKKVSIASLVSVFLFPALSSAVTIDDLQSQISALLAQVKVLQQQLAQQQSSSSNGKFCYTFENDFGIGNSGDKTSALLNILVKEGLATKRSSNFDENFDETLASSVSAFQEKYRGEILTPIGLKNATGYVSLRTRAKLNALYGCDQGNLKDLNIIKVKTDSNSSGDVTQKGILSIFPSSLSLAIGENKTLSALFQAPPPACINSNPPCLMPSLPPYPVTANWLTGDTSVISMSTKLTDTCVSTKGINDGKTGTSCTASSVIVTGLSLGQAVISASASYDNAGNSYKVSASASAEVNSNIKVKEAPTITNIQSAGNPPGTVDAGRKASLYGTGLHGFLTIKIGSQEVQTVYIFSKSDSYAEFIVPLRIQSADVSVTVISNRTGLTSDFYQLKIQVPPILAPSPTYYISTPNGLSEASSASCGHTLFFRVNNYNDSRIWLEQTKNASSSWNGLYTVPSTFLTACNRDEGVYVNKVYGVANDNQRGDLLGSVMFTINSLNSNSAPSSMADSSAQLANIITGVQKIIERLSQINAGQ